MSESREAKIMAQPRRTGLFIGVALFCLVALGYPGGYFFLPRSIQAAYAAKDCDTVLQRRTLFLASYPRFLTGVSDDHVMECAVHVLALRAEGQSDLSAAYEAYRVYAESYPDGLFRQEARDRSAEILLQLADEQLTQGQYAEAISALDRIRSEYAGTPAAGQAEQTYPELYQAWGAGLEQAGDYDGAERVFRDLTAWAQAHGQPDLAKTLQGKLAQLYRTRAQALQADKQYAPALAALQMVRSLDPSAGDPAVAAKLYYDWGQALMQQKDIPGAMEKYGLAAALSESADPVFAADVLAGAYVQWAAEASAGEDFLGAQVLLEHAKAEAASGTSHSLVESARAQLYPAFSRSTGEQAGQALQDAVRIVCEHHIPARLPIFGLDPENKRVGLHGADAKLPEKIAATTPGTLHYAVCIEQENRLIQTLRLPISAIYFGLRSGIFHIDYRNYQYVWNVTLRETATGQEIARTVVEGTRPANLGPYDIEITRYSYYGPLPNVADLAAWIIDAIR